jgi:UDP-3-O-[3-hydroxymyristoyl] glucosamine N-acyltransferase
MKFTAQQIAAVVQGEIQGNADVSVWNMAKIEEAKEGDICFLANAKYVDFLYTTKASVVLINSDFELKQDVHCTLVKVKDAYASFALLLQTYQDITATKPKEIIEQPSFIASTASVGEKVYIGAFTYVGDHVQIGANAKIFPGCFLGEKVRIGANTILHAGVKIYHECILGDNVIIHAGTVIGSDGFGFAFENGSFKKIPQIGNVVIEDNVEVGANTTIDRATMGSTIIRQGAKLDNLIQIAHNVELGQHTVVAAQAGISGSTKVGKYCMVGGQAGIVGHIKIADFTKINAQSGVAKEIKQEHTSLTGSPAYDYKSSLKSQVVYRNLPDLLKRMNELENKLNELTSKH